VPDSPIAERRLLIVHSSADRYGSDLACLRIAAAAAAEGWSLDVLLPSAGPLVDDLRALGINVLVLDPIVLRRADLTGVGPLLLPFRWARGVVALRSFTRGRPAYDVVHSNCAPTLGGALIARWSKARHVWYVHEVFTSSRQRRVFDRLLQRAADLVLACSAAALAQFPRVVEAGMGRVAHTGVEVPADAVVAEPLRAAVPVVVCVGRLNSWKGQEVLVDAIARLRSRGIDVRAELVGSVFRDERHFEERLRSQVDALGIADHVSFLGERRDVLAIVGSADIAVLPSTRPEPFGMALVEAMALGRPVVASSAGGPAEVVTDGVDGLLVRPRDAVALADALQRLIEDPDFARTLGTHAKARAADFSSTSMTTKVLASYDELLAKGPR
jgi:glycosyltransferase involved in cell wall biosynthesis